MSNPRLVLRVNGHFVEACLSSSKEFKENPQISPHSNAKPFHPSTVSHFGKVSASVPAQASNSTFMLYHTLIEEGREIGADYVLYCPQLDKISADKSSRSIEAEVYVKNPPSLNPR